MMKNIFLLLWLLTSMCGKTLAQPYSHYFDSTTRWCYYINYSFESYRPHHTSTDNFEFTTAYLDGDTVIHGITYFKKYSIEKDSIINKLLPEQPATVTISPPKYIGAIREDSLNRIYGSYDDTDYLDEDYKLSVGDSFPYPLYGKIILIDTVYFGTTPLKHLHGEGVLQNNIHADFIEGIGNISFGISGHGYFICYYKQGVWLNWDKKYDCDYFPVPVYSASRK